jgi:hypothetical protein
MLPTRRDTRARQLQVWISFGVAATLCAIGLAWWPGQDLDRAFMAMGCVFCLSTAFALPKFIRDNQHQKVDTPMWGSVVWAGFGLAMALSIGSAVMLTALACGHALGAAGNAIAFVPNEMGRALLHNERITR